MNRGRVKGKNQNEIIASEDPGSTEGLKILPIRRRGRPQKALKVDVEKSHISRDDIKNHPTIENDTKRKRSAHVDENINYIQEENIMEIKSILDEPLKSLEFRQLVCQRAAEAGVHCI